MNPDETDLSDMLISWTGMTVTWISVVIFALGAIGLFMSFSSFMNLYGSVKNTGDQGMRTESPLWHVLGIIVGGFISVSGLVWGGSSLIFAGIAAVSGCGAAGSGPC
mgnify:CR=1 FL=1